MNPGRLLFPAIRWHEELGYEAARDQIERGLMLGAGGFILFGGTADAAAGLIRELQQRSPHPLLIAADLERGAGQQFAGATSLPPAAAIGALEDHDVTRRAAAVTAREARAIGVSWILAPVADVDLEPDNPIVGTRAFGSDPLGVAAHIRAWVEGCHEYGILSTAKHFPGHGRSIGDSHAVLPVVSATAGALEMDLAPFRAAISAGVDAIMSAHVAYPALDPSGTTATLSPVILTSLLRDTLKFDGLIVSDALNMAGVQLAAAQDRTGQRFTTPHHSIGAIVSAEAAAAVRAVAAGCDALLYPEDPAAVVAALNAAREHEQVEARTEQAIGRIEAAARRVNAPAHEYSGADEDRSWAEQTALAAVQPVRGQPRLPAASFDLLTVDDDLGGPLPPPPRDAFPAALRRAGWSLRELHAPGPSEQPLVVAVYCDIRAWKERPGCSARTIDAVATVFAQRSDALLVLFGHPRIAAELPGRDVLLAWGGESLMQVGAARWLTR